MKFAKAVFLIAGIIGVPAAIGMYFTPGTEVYYGSLAAIVAWQPAFFAIARDPGRFRPMMIPSVIEKMVWVATFVFFYLRGGVDATEVAMRTSVHFVLGVLFIVAFFKAGNEGRP